MALVANRPSPMTLSTGMISWESSACKCEPSAGRGEDAGLEASRLIP